MNPDNTNRATILRPLAVLIEKIASRFAELAAAKSIAFRVFADGDVSASICPDLALIEAVLTHLLENGLRFTQAGTLRLDVRSDSDDDASDSARELRFTVIDTGPGIARDRAGSVFAEGTRLALLRAQILAAGGDLRFHSEPAEGATFWFTLSCGAGCQDERTPAVPINGGRPMRILIAEDNEINQLILGEQVDALGHSYVTVPNGNEALAALDRQGWDVLLLDCQMPQMDGYETIAAIREREAAGKPRTYVIAVTANALAGEREACLHAGMDDFLSKPFHLQQLGDAISRAPAGSRAEPGAADFPNSPVASVHPMASPIHAGNGQESPAVTDRQRKLGKIFVETGDAMLEDLERALAVDDFETAINTVHKLGGGSIYIGAPELRVLCLAAEEKGRAGNNAGLRYLAAEIRQEYDRVAARLGGTEG